MIRNTPELHKKPVFMVTRVDALLIELPRDFSDCAILDRRLVLGSDSQQILHLRIDMRTLPSASSRLKLVKCHSVLEGNIIRGVKFWKICLYMFDGTLCSRSERTSQVMKDHLDVPFTHHITKIYIHKNICPLLLPLPCESCFFRQGNSQKR